MKDKINVLGNQEEQKQIKRLLKQAKEDKFIDAVVKGVAEEKKTPEFKISSKFADDEYWRVSGVHYRDGVYTVDLLKRLLESGQRAVQSMWADHAKGAIKEGEFYTADLPLYYSLFRALYDQRDKPESEEARKFIEAQMTDRFLMTLTSIMYNPPEVKPDEIKHAMSYDSDDNIKGANGNILDPRTEAGVALHALLRTTHIKRINDVYHWICKKDVRIERASFVPASIKRIVLFGASFEKVILACSGNATPEDTCPALGVRIAGEEK